MDRLKDPKISQERNNVVKDSSKRNDGKDEGAEENTEGNEG